MACPGLWRDGRADDGLEDVVHAQADAQKKSIGIVAPLVLDGPINGRAFLAWVEQFLAPTLHPGQIVIADRLGSHKVAGVREAIEARGASLMLLPPYSHDYNPIEQVFAKLKALLRKAAPRTRELLWRTIGEKISMFLPAECMNYLRNCGYGHPA